MSLPARRYFQSYPYLVILLCAAFLFYKYVLQIYPSIITDALMKDFNLTGSGLGNLAATFYYAFMITQLIVGIMLDRFSTRYITSAAIFACALGALLFANAHSMWSACLARSLMGIGVAFATVAYMKLAAIWFHPRHFAFISGLLASAAMAGAVFGQAPLSWLMTQFGWQTCLTGIAVAGMVLAILFLMIVRDQPITMENIIKPSRSHIRWLDIINVLKSKQNWLLTLYGGLAFSPIAVFGGLWGNPFLQQAYHITKLQGATLVSLVFIGLGLGSPILGWFAELLKMRKPLMIYCTAISCLAISLVLYVNTMPMWLTGILLFTFGFGLGAFVLVFTIGKEQNPLYLTATVIAMINASDAVLDAITEPAIGKLLDLNWTGTIQHGIHYFSLHSYYIALSVLPIYLLLATAILFWINDQAYDTPSPLP